MRYFSDTFLTHITVSLPQVKGSELAYEALSMVPERERQYCFYVRYL